jgi:hypothetical protein
MLTVQHFDYFYFVLNDPLARPARGRLHFQLRLLKMIFLYFIADPQINSTLK